MTRLLLQATLVAGLVFAGLAFSMHSNQNAAASSDALAPYEWTFRPLAVFAPSADDDRLAALRRLVDRNAPAMRERDMLVAEVLPDGGRLMPVPGSATPSLKNLSDVEAQALRRRFKVAPEDFVMILVGKDGGEKHRYAAAEELERSFIDIDRMPMRKREMRSSVKDAGVLQ